MANLTIQTSDSKEQDGSSLSDRDKLSIKKRLRKRNDVSGDGANHDSDKLKEKDISIKSKLIKNIKNQEEPKNKPSNDSTNNVKAKSEKDTIAYPTTPIPLTIIQTEQGLVNKTNENVQFRGRLGAPDIGYGTRADKSNLDFGSRLVGYLILLTIPILLLLLCGWIVLSLFRFCLQCFGYKAKRQSERKSKRLKQKSNQIFQTNVPSGIISNGKIVGSSHIKGDDKSQLAINMEDASSEDSEYISSSRYNPSWAKKLEKPSQECSQGQKTSLKSMIKSLKSSSNDSSGKSQAGRLKYRIDYDFTKNVLTIGILEAQNLPAMDIGGSSDPYVKVYLLPDTRKYEKTQVHKKTLNPIFNETFEFNIGYTDLMGRTIVFTVYDYDRFSRHDLIGHISIPVESMDLSVTKEEWQDLKREPEGEGSEVSK